MCLTYSSKEEGMCNVFTIYLVGSARRPAGQGGRGKGGWWEQQPPTSWSDHDVESLNWSNEKLVS